MHIEYDLLDATVRDAILASAGDLFRRINRASNKPADRLFRRQTWPALKGLDPTDDINPVLVLTPLDRLGVPLGLSGSHVLIGYFTVQEDDRLLRPSRPFIVKYEVPKGGRDKLKEEDENAATVEVYLSQNVEQFALPLYFEETPSSCSVLWAPFASSEWLEASGYIKRLKLKKIRDLFSVLRDNEYPTAKKVVDQVYKMLRQLHASREELMHISLYTHYQWYLRGIDTDEWGESWRRIWGSGDEVHEFGLTWANPLNVLKHIKTLEKFGVNCGAVHGDLHPRNIILGVDSRPNIIDFGWTRDEAHVAQEFVLLECNLRFVSLHADVSMEDMIALARWIGLHDEEPVDIDERCSGRLDIIRLIRKHAKKVVFRSGVSITKESWLIHYTIPMFLVALGLLKHLAGFDNQVATRLHVLSLATHVRNGLLAYSY